MVWKQREDVLVAWLVGLSKRIAGKEQQRRAIERNERRRHGKVTEVESDDEERATMMMMMGIACCWMDGDGDELSWLGVDEKQEITRE